MPCVGERLSLVGFKAAEIAFDGAAPIGLALIGSVGTVTDVYPVSRDTSSLPNPRLGVEAITINGLSGGTAFDEAGNLIGIISKGFEGSSVAFLARDVRSDRTEMAPEDDGENYVSGRFGETRPVWNRGPGRRRRLEGRRWPRNGFDFRQHA